MSADDNTFKLYVGRAMAKAELSPETYSELAGEEMTVTPEKLYGQTDDDQTDYSGIRVKDASERYSEKRYATSHKKTGQPIVDPIYNEQVCSQSEASKARTGVLIKHLANKSGVTNNPLSEHEKGLLNDLTENHPWCGKIGSEHFDYIKSHTTKALIDDAVSGGLEITPIEFDRDIVSFPLLGGELYPQVDVKLVPRGRRIEGASIQTPTLAWGGGDDTQIALFNTAGPMVAPIDTTIFTVDGAVELGLDFLSDSPIDVGSVVTGLIGERLQNELDDVIANGNGTTQPQGIFNSGLGVDATTNGVGGGPTLDDYEDLLFGLAKQYRKASYRPCFLSNDTTFARSRGIQIDGAGTNLDIRPVMAPLTEINEYRTLGWPHLVQNDIGNSLACFVCMAKYRMYRRLGLSIRFETGGTTLARRNMALLLYRARFGGRLMDVNAAIGWVDGQA